MLMYPGLLDSATSIHSAFPWVLMERIWSESRARNTLDLREAGWIVPHTHAVEIAAFRVRTHKGCSGAGRGWDRERCPEVWSWR